MVGWQEVEADTRERRLLEVEGRKREVEELLEVSREKQVRSEGAVHELKTRLGWDIEKMVKKHEEEVRAVREAARCAERALRLEVEGREREVEERHKAELAREREQPKVEEHVVSTLRAENTALRTQVDQLEAKVSALVVSVMQGADPRDSTIGGLQQEVASLGVVLELRTRELREVQRERRAQESKEGELQKSQEKVRALEARVEDLNAQVIMKKRSEQSLEVEMERLQLRQECVKESEIQKSEHDSYVKDILEAKETREAESGKMQLERQRILEKHGEEVQDIKVQLQHCTAELGRKTKEVSCCPVLDIPDPLPPQCAQTVALLATMDEEKTELKKSSDRLLRKVDLLKEDTDR